MPEQRMPQVGYIPMDANLNVSNRLERGKVEEMMISTLNDLAEVLKDHCGPYGKFAVINSPGNIGAEPVFTKDGINIVRSIDYLSPLQQFLRHTLMYMGSRVESTAGDGTTSAMIIMAVAMRELINNLKHIPCTFYQLSKLYQDTFSAAMDDEYQERYVYTIDKFKTYLKAHPELEGSLQDAIRYIAYCQAYTSSHGDEELSNIIAELFASTPQEVWHLFSIDKARYETEQRYMIDTEVCQWKVEDCVLFPLAQMTDEFGSSSIRTGERTIITDRTPSVGDDYTKGVRDQMEQAILNNEHLTIITSGSLDSPTNMWLSGLFQKNSNHHLSIYLIPPGDYGMWNDIPYLKIVSGQAPQENMEFTLDYRFDGRNLVIKKGLYETVDTEDPTCHLHPFYKDPQYEIYNSFVERLEHQIKQQSSVVSTRETNKALSHMRKMLSKLIVVNRNYFRIGGSAYDNAAAVDVAVDVLTAVKNSLTVGFTMGANKTLYRFFEGKLQVRAAHDTDEPSNEERINNTICQAFMVAIKETYEALYRFSGGNGPEFNSFKPFNLLVPADAFDKYPEFYYMCCLKEENKPVAVIQPVNTDKAIVKRFGEVALRFVKTARLISEGGMYVNKEEKQ